MYITALYYNIFDMCIVMYCGGYDCRLLSWKPGDSPAVLDSGLQSDSPNKDFKRSESTQSVNSHGSIVSQDNHNHKIPNTSMSPQLMSMYTYNSLWQIYLLPGLSKCSTVKSHKRITPHQILSQQQSCWAPSHTFAPITTNLEQVLSVILFWFITSKF